MARPTTLSHETACAIISARFPAEGEPAALTAIAARFGVTKGVVAGLCRRAQERIEAGGPLLPPAEVRHTAPTQRQITAKVRGTRLRNPPKENAGTLRAAQALLAGGGGRVIAAPAPPPKLPPPPPPVEVGGGDTPAPRPGGGMAPPSVPTAPLSLHRRCQYPHGFPGQPDFRFCGEPAVQGKSWCPACLRRVFLSTLPGWAKHAMTVPR